MSILVKDEFDFEANEQELLSQQDSVIQKVSVKDTSSSNTLTISDDFEFKDEVNLTSYGKKRRVIVVSAEKDMKKKRVHVHRNQRRNLSKEEDENEYKNCSAKNNLSRNNRKRAAAKNIDIANNMKAKTSSSENISSISESKEALQDTKNDAVQKSTATMIQIGTEFQKEFHGKYYRGKVVRLPNKRSKWYKVKYEDDDSEELDREELMALIKDMGP
ncbi:predicted protein [Chaetoceros tenuissimus]|uniref:PTM/DIR17-like Tudor domain-containing protein n=1 Tax=Chaetoceros tenuissimus TaxID=426638 RepID=A0AAD3H2A7_9STRA|nr:predicted protein [Chaetoceros tenuissimus]